MAESTNQTGISGVLFGCLLLIAGCSSPTGPTAPSALSTAPDALSTTPDLLSAASVGTQAAQSPTDFAARGWTCGPVPLTTNQVACTPPPHGLPTHPPAPDRPPSFTFLLWEDGTFIGQIFLIRDDLYQNQPCESTGTPYEPRLPIGYYSCVRRIGP